MPRHHRNRPHRPFREFRSESAFTRESMSWIRNRFGDDVWGWKVNDNFTRGILDICLCLCGYFVAVELKNGETEKKPHEELQNHNMAKIQRANGFAFKAKNMDELKSGLEKIYDIVKKRT